MLKRGVLRFARAAGGCFILRKGAGLKPLVGAGLRHSLAREAWWTRASGVWRPRPKYFLIWHQQKLSAASPLRLDARHRTFHGLAFE